MTLMSPTQLIEKVITRVFENVLPVCVHPAHGVVFYVRLRSSIDECITSTNYSRFLDSGFWWNRMNHPLELPPGFETKLKFPTLSKKLALRQLLPLAYLLKQCLGSSSTLVSCMFWPLQQRVFPQLDNLICLNAFGSDTFANAAWLSVVFHFGSRLVRMFGSTVDNITVVVYYYSMSLIFPTGIDSSSLCPGWHPP